METDKAILLQKQIRDNSDDLHKEFLDMAAWEEQMKKKDLEIRSMKDDQDLPPVRTKKKKKTSSSPEVSDEKPNKTKRIGAFDYNSWDKFDADKACDDIDKKDDAKEKEEKVNEIPPKEVLDKEHAEATKLKEEGNILVLKQEYAKAVGKYSQAIKIFPHDAVFYANRALCQLKLNNLYSAEADCTTAIKLNSVYVKAYHRRATARMELKRYRDACKDLEMVIQLDPSNKDAVSKIIQAQKQIEKESLIISGEKNVEKSGIEKKIGDKLFKKEKTISTQNKDAKHSEQNEDKNIEEVEARTSTSKDENIVIKQIIEEKVGAVRDKKEQSTTQIEKPKNEQNKNLSDSGGTESTVNDELPLWLPKLKKGLSIVEPLTDVPRRLNETLNRIPVKEVPPNESIFKGVEEITEEKTEDKENLKVESEICPTYKTNNKTNNKSSNEDTETINNIPPPPKSSVAFLINWRKNTLPSFRYKYLKQINPKDLPDIFKESMESNIFSEILSILNTIFIPKEDKVYDFVYNLSKLKRFRALILFMTSEDKNALKNLFEHCKEKEGRTNEEVNYLYSAYEM